MDTATTAIGRPAPLATRRLRVASALVSIGALAAVVWWAAHQEPPSLPSGAGELAALLGAIVNYALTTAVRAERWGALLRRAGADPRRGDCYALTAVGYMGNNVLPARGGDVLRVVLLAPRARTGKRTVVGTLLAERVLDVAVLLALFAALAYGLARGIGSGLGAGRIGVIAGAAAVVCALAVAVPLAARRSERAARALRFARPMLAAVADLRSRFGLRMVAVSLLIWTMEAGTWWLCGLAVGLGADPLEAVYLVALSSLFIFIPAGPGYAGTLDAAVVVGVRAIGGTGRAAISYLLVLRFVLLVPITLVGLLLLVLRYGGAARATAWGWTVGGEA